MWRVVNRAVEVYASRGLVLEDTKPHDLRHTFAHCYLEQNAGDLIGRARLLGHESLDTTKIYTSWTSLAYYNIFVQATVTEKSVAF